MKQETKDRIKGKHLMSKMNKYVVSFDDPGCSIIWVRNYNGVTTVGRCFVSKKSALKRYNNACKQGLHPVLNVLTPVKE